MAAKIENNSEIQVFGNPDIVDGCELHQTCLGCPEYIDGMCFFDIY